MSHRPVTADSPEEPRRNASAATAFVQLLDFDVDRPKRIDQYLDYFVERGLSARLAPRVSLHHAPS